MSFGDEYMGDNGVDAPVFNDAVPVVQDGSAIENADGQPDRPKYIYLGVAGDLHIKFKQGGTTRIFKNAGIGYHPLRPYSVEAASTCTDILALF